MSDNLLPLGFCLRWDTTLIFALGMADLVLWASFLCLSATIFYAWWTGRVARFTEPRNAPMWAAAAFAVAMSFLWPPALAFLPAYGLALAFKITAALLHGYLSVSTMVQVLRPDGRLIEVHHA